MPIATIDPTTGETVKVFDALSDSEIEARVALAAKAFAAFRATTFAERAEILNAVAKILDAEQEDAAQIMTREMGKTLKAARAEVAKCARTFRYYARHGWALPTRPQPGTLTRMTRTIATAADI